MCHYQIQKVARTWNNNKKFSACDRRTELEGMSLNGTYGSVSPPEIRRPIYERRKESPWSRAKGKFFSGIFQILPNGEVHHRTPCYVFPPMESHAVRPLRRTQFPSPVPENKKFKLTKFQFLSLRAADVNIININNIFL